MTQEQYLVEERGAVVLVLGFRAVRVSVALKAVREASAVGRTLEVAGEVTDVVLLEQQMSKAITESFYKR